MYCNKDQFPELSFSSPPSKHHGAMGLIKHYHLLFDTKLVMGVCAICCIPCACVDCTSMIERPGISGISSDKQELYQRVTKCTYWPVLESFNNWNIIKLSPKSTSPDTFDEIHQVVLDGISDNMALLVEAGKYGDINTTDTSTNGFYVIMFTSGAYILPESTTINGQIITSGELVVKAQYLCSMQVDNNWYWNQQPKQNIITLPTSTILHTQL